MTPTIRERRPTATCLLGCVHRIPVGRRYRFGEINVLGSGSVFGGVRRVALVRPGPPYGLLLLDLNEE